MERFFKRLRPHIGLISKILIFLGAVMLILSVWGFVKGSHAGMTSKNGSKATLSIVKMRVPSMALGAVFAGGGIALLKKSDTDDEDDEPDDDMDDLGDI